MIHDVGIVVAAAGAATRFGGQDKLLADLGGQPVILRTLSALSACCPDERLIIVVNPERANALRDAVNRFFPRRAFRFVFGGKTRAESVLNGLKALDRSVAVVAVHDAARPFVTEELLRRSVALCREKGGAVAARRVTDTLKRVAPDGTIVSTVDRAALWAMETPQTFPLAKLREAYERAIADGANVTDDAAAMERLGYPVSVMETAAINLKITWPEDLILANWLVGRSEKTGQGPALRPER